MKVSLSLIQYYSGQVQLPELDVLIKRIGAQLGAVEDVVQWGPRYEDIVVAKVINCEKHPDADKLSVCLVDDGGVVKDMERNNDGLVQVVCGAPNIAAGQTVAWLPPGVVVPSTVEKDPFTLTVREIRGVKSNGMIASPAELAISDDHDGILVIVAEEVGEEAMQPGTPLQQLYNLDDTIIDLENKMFTHRPDCFGILGVARELAGITGQAYKSPDWYLEDPEFKPDGDELPLKIFNDTDLVPRFTAAVVSSVTVQPSPIWVQAALQRMGIKPINSVVDTTNFIMQVTAQPLHAFDYDKLKQFSSSEVSLGPRLARRGEKIKLLNGKEIELDESDVVIATDGQAVALAGIMGGVETEVDENTKSIVLEAATFDMYAIRRSTMRHGLFTDAATRYTKGQSPLQNLKVLRHAVRLLESGGAKLASQALELGDYQKEQPAVEAGVDFINTRLGSELSGEDMAVLLENVEFKAKVKDNALLLEPPFWRMDVEAPEDVVEEVGRLYGFDNLPVVLPKRSTRPPRRNQLLEIKSRIRQILASAGANEALTYSFVHGQLLTNAGQSSEEAYSLRNALSPDLHHYRLTLTPSLLASVHSNIKSGHDKFALFEIGKTHVKMHGQTEEDVPKELEMTSLVIAANDKLAKDGAAYFEARKLLDFLAARLGISLRYEALSEEPPFQVCKPYDWRRSALVYAEEGDVFIGMVGEPTAATRRAFKLPQHTAMFELGTDGLLEASAQMSYKPVSRFPASSQDITLETSKEVNFASVSGCLSTTLTAVADEYGYLTELTPIGIYDTGEKLRYTFRLNLSHPQKTLRTEEVTAVVDILAESANKELKTERI